MKLNTFTSILSVHIAVLAGTAHAFCGFYVGKADANLFNEASQVIVVRDGDRTVVSMLNDYKGELKEFAIVVPVPSVLQKDQINVGVRRQCGACDKRFTTYERPEVNFPVVVKKDGRRERFERQKLVAGLLKACEKRPVRVSALEDVADKVETALQEKPEREISTEEIGAHVMEALRQLDKVAYVRFASVYRNFRDIDEFKHELNDLFKS